MRRLNCLGQGARNPVTGFDIAYYGDSRYLGWGGGLPVWADGEVVGAVAVSGLPEADNMEMAQIGFAATLAPAPAASAVVTGAVAG
jgi:glc operon protein GlcG